MQPHGGAVACPATKSASGQNVGVPEVHQQKNAATHGKHRENLRTPSGFTTDKVVVENNALGTSEEPLIHIYPVNPLAKFGIVDEHGHKVPGGGGLIRAAKSSKAKLNEGAKQDPSLDAVVKEAGKINAGKFGHLELDSLTKSGSAIDPAAKSGNFTIAGRGLQKHGSREGSAYPAAKGTPAQINEQGQKVLDEIVKSSSSSVKEGNRFGGFDVIAPDGRGARFDPQGNFRGFLEP
ncbi:hypothetical protein [Izhakiella australiensis]|uniref:hypothetical protein n=1 Tax=Izhakiella australiensis TaxID=1926881 RepID=UPI001F5232C8|nr:hypothetical protein [Izhakiella australiensis]